MFRAIEQHVFHIGIGDLNLIVVVEKDDAFHAVFKVVNACLAFPVLLFDILISSSSVCHYTAHIGKCFVVLCVFSFELPFIFYLIRIYYSNKICPPYPLARTAPFPKK